MEELARWTVVTAGANLFIFNREEGEDCIDERSPRLPMTPIRGHVCSMSFETRGPKSLMPCLIWEDIMGQR